MATIGSLALSSAFRWSREEAVDGAVMLAVALGVGLPVLFGAWWGQLPLGLGIAMGGLLAANAKGGRNLRERARDLGAILLTAALAAGASEAIVGRGYVTDLALLVLAGIAAVAGGYSKLVGLAAGRFIIFLFLTVNLAERAPRHIGVLMPVATGVIFTGAMILFFGAILLAVGLPGGPPAVRPSRATAAQKFRRWWLLMQCFAGWQFAFRLLPCLAVAGLLRQWFPDHHFLWIALTVAILTTRQPEPLPLKAIQRSVGAAIGVTATGMLVGDMVSPWVLAGVAAGLGLLMPWLRARNYLAFTAILTPLVILLIDGGQRIEPGLLVDRLVATMIGAVMVTVATMALGRRAARSHEW